MNKQDKLKRKMVSNKLANNHEFKDKISQKYLTQTKDFIQRISRLHCLYQKPE